MSLSMKRRIFFLIIYSLEYTQVKLIFSQIGILVFHSMTIGNLFGWSVLQEIMWTSLP